MKTYIVQFRITGPIDDGLQFGGFTIDATSIDKAIEPAKHELLEYLLGLPEGCIGEVWAIMEAARPNEKLKGALNVGKKLS